MIFKIRFENLKIKNYENKISISIDATNYGIRARI